METSQLASARRRLPALAWLGAALLVCTAPGIAHADWLVTHEGARLETQGPWEVKGKLIVFTMADGTFASIQSTIVDLDASKKATAEKQKMMEEDIARPPEKKKSVRSITDKDFVKPPADGDAAGAAEGKTGSADGKASKETPVKRSTALVMGTWTKRERDAKDGIELIGDIRNESSDIASEVTLKVTLLDDGGGVLATADAELTANTIEPRGAANFRAVFPGVFTFASAKFDSRTVPLQLHVLDLPGEKKNP